MNENAAVSIPAEAAEDAKKGQVRRMISLAIKFIHAIKTPVSPCFCITVFTW